jgi:hypothetical protein
MVSITFTWPPADQRCCLPALILQILPIVDQDDPEIAQVAVGAQHAPGRP